MELLRARSRAGLEGSPQSSPSMAQGSHMLFLNTSLRNVIEVYYRKWERILKPKKRKGPYFSKFLVLKVFLIKSMRSLTVVTIYQIFIMCPALRLAFYICGENKIMLTTWKADIIPTLQFRKPRLRVQQLAQGHTLGRRVRIKNLCIHNPRSRLLPHASCSVDT